MFIKIKKIFCKYQISVGTGTVGNRWESLEQAAESKLKNRISYDKGHLPNV